MCRYICGPGSVALIMWGLSVNYVWPKLTHTYIYIQIGTFFFSFCCYNFFGGQQPLVPLLCPPFLSNYSFWVHHIVNRDDRHLLADASQLHGSVSQREQLLLYLSRINHHIKGVDETWHFILYQERDTTIFQMKCISNLTSNLNTKMRVLNI
jgi:hypothetical protein